MEQKYAAGALPMTGLADYAKYPIMESCWSERVASADWLWQAGIPTFT